MKLGLANAYFQQQKNSPALVIVDYVQLMDGGSGNRQQDLAGISRGLKVLAGKPIPGDDNARTAILALSQLKRDVDDRPDKRPMLKDLRETGALEQDADGVLGIYREDVYKRGTDKEGMAEISVLKARSGPTGTIECAYISNYTKYAKDHPAHVTDRGVTCFQCKSPKIHTKNLMQGSFTREHHCGQCGTTLYYSPEQNR